MRAGREGVPGLGPPAPRRRAQLHCRRRRVAEAAAALAARGAGAAPDATAAAGAAGGYVSLHTSAVASQYRKSLTCVAIIVTALQASES